MTLSLNATAKVCVLLALVVAGLLVAGPAGFGPGGPNAEATSLPELKILLASDAESSDAFGYSAAIDGDTAIVGARLEDAAGIYSGAAYVYERNQGGTDNWGQVKKFVASDAQADDRFGQSVAVSGDTAVVGAWFEDAGGSAAGAAYVFRRNEGGADNWGQVKKLVASDAQGGDAFGSSVAISVDTVVVGAVGEATGGSAAGAAYVFQRNEGGTDNWGEVRKLIASDADVFDQFGLSVSISGDTVLVGAPRWFMDFRIGKAYVFYRNHGGANIWGEVKKLTASDTLEFDTFGASVAVSGDTAVIGAYRAIVAGRPRGAAYVFQRDEGGANNWGELSKLTASDAQDGDRFGDSVSISGDTVVVGALLVDTWGFQAGAAYVLGRDHGGTDNWGEVTKLRTSDIQSLDNFGDAVAVSGNTAVLGAPGHAGGWALGAGAAYVFDLLLPKPTPTVTPTPTTTPTPTITPTPLDTATPTPTFTPCPGGPCPAPEMILNVPGGDCDDATRPTTCDLPLGSKFTLIVEIAGAPPERYVAAASFIHYGDDLIYNPAASAADEIVWPDCEQATALRAQVDATNPLLNPTGYTVNHGCLTGLLPPLPESDYVGDFVRVSMTCSSVETSTVVAQLPYDDATFPPPPFPPLPATIQFTSGSAFFYFSGAVRIDVVPNLSDLTINCVQPPPPVGGIALGADAALRPLGTPKTPGNSFGVLAWAIAGSAAAVALGGGVWWLRRRTP